MKDNINDTPRITACIEAVMQRYPSDKSTVYFTAVHQELAPLARELERENIDLRAALALAQAPSAPVARQPLENIEQLGEREAFEKEMRSMGATNYTLRKWVAVTDAGATYQNREVQTHWSIWQARAALSVKADSYPEIPDRWKLVPNEPTEEMDAAARAECHRMAGCLDPVIHIWDVMLAAAPTPPTTGEA